MITRDPLFSLGQVVATPGALAQIGPGDFAMLLARHSRGEWGDLCDEDKATNNAALKDGSRILSAYTLNDTKFWIITEADRSVTTLLLPEEY